MKQLSTLFLLLLLSISLLHSQNIDTTYFNGDWEETDINTAVYYRIGKRDAGKSEGKITDYYLSGGVQMTGNYSNFSKHGVFVWYYPNGNKKAENIYV
jgi:protein TonB